MQERGRYGPLFGKMSQGEEPQVGGANHGDWRRVGVFSTRSEAETARSALEARGITSTLHGDDEGGMGIPMSLEHQGVEVQVPSEHWAAARQMLESPQEPDKSKPINRVAILMVALLIVVVAVGTALDMSL